MKVTRQQATGLAAVLPIVFAIVTVFFTYQNIGVFLIIGLLLALTEFGLWYFISSDKSNLKEKLKMVLPLALIFVGAVGATASTNLVRDKLAILEDPSFSPSCSLNPVLACNPVIDSDEADPLGIPNPVLGLFAFAAIFTAGFSLLAGGVFARWWWRGLWLGVVGGFLAVLWMIYHSLYTVEALCIYCMVTWLLIIPLFWYMTLYMLQQDYLSVDKKYWGVFERNHLFLPILSVLVVITLIYFKFDYYWNTLI